MEKQIRFTGIDCPHCAEKIEKKINKIEGVESAQINFLSQKINLVAKEEDMENIIKEIEEVARKVEKDFQIL